MYGTTGNEFGTPFPERPVIYLRGLRSSSRLCLTTCGREGRSGPVRRGKPQTGTSYSEREESQQRIADLTRLAIRIQSDWTASGKPGVLHCPVPLAGGPRHADEPLWTNCSCLLQSGLNIGQEVATALDHGGEELGAQVYSGIPCRRSTNHSTHARRRRPTISPLPTIT